MSNRSLLLVDVDVSHGAALAGWAARSGFGVVDTSSLPGSEIEQFDVAIAVLGLHLGGDEAFDRVRAAAKLLRSTPLVVLARGLDVETAFRLREAGVSELIGLPADPVDVVARVASRVATNSGGQAELAELVGESPSMRALRREIQSAARVESKVLLQGETGTGKGLIARLIHEGSPRRDGPFVHVDCAALSPTLIESELFGHEKGAFTGAGGLRRGRFEVAATGTIFLDEIGDLDLPLQSKLLRVLEDRVFERVGGSQALRMSARVIAATCHDLFRKVQQRLFRQDLYFRLNVITLEVPPLRDRIEDLPALVSACARRLATTLGIAPVRFDESFHERLQAHAWPGNVRELVNLLERLLVQNGSRTFEAADLDGLLRSNSADGGDAAPAVDLRPPLELDEDEARDAERIAAALSAAGGNVSRTSRRLEMPRGTIRHRIHKYRLEHLVQKD